MILLTLASLLLAQQVIGSDSGRHEDGCGIYPSCWQYGAGTWQILEDCSKYIRCHFENGDLVQENLECPGDLVYAEEYGECVEWDKATECKVFQETPCFYSCPRVYLDSSGYAQEYQENRIGCFRLTGTMLGIMPYYQNMNGQYLAPDSQSNQLVIHWLVGERYGAFNGGIRNKKYDYIRCPFTKWNEGWQVDKGQGHWVEDTTMTATCYSGDEDRTTSGPTPSSATTTPNPATTSSSTTTMTTTATTTMRTTVTTTKTTTAANTTPTTQPSVCHKEGPNMVDRCMVDFNCCHWVASSNTWQVKKCTCHQDLVFSEDFEICTWPDMEGCTKESDTPSFMEMTRLDHTCEDGSYCDPA